MDHFQKLHGAVLKGLISKELEVTVTHFFLSYTEAALENNYTAKEIQALLVQFIELVIDQLKNPYLFESFHKMIKKPVEQNPFWPDPVARQLSGAKQSRQLILIPPV